MLFYAILPFHNILRGVITPPNYRRLVPIIFIRFCRSLTTRSLELYQVFQVTRALNIFLSTKWKMENLIGWNPNYEKRHLCQPCSWRSRDISIEAISRESHMRQEIYGNCIIFIALGKAIGESLRKDPLMGWWLSGCQEIHWPHSDRTKANVKWPQYIAIGHRNRTTQNIRWVLKLLCDIRQDPC